MSMSTAETKHTHQHCSAPAGAGKSVLAGLGAWVEVLACGMRCVHSPSSSGRGTYQAPAASKSTPHQALTATFVPLHVDRAQVDQAQEMQKQSPERARVATRQSADQRTGFAPAWAGSAVRRHVCRGISSTYEHSADSLLVFSAPLSRVSCTYLTAGADI